MVAPYEVGIAVRSYVNVPHSRGIMYKTRKILTFNLVPHQFPAEHHQHISTSRQHPSSLQQGTTLQQGESEGRTVCSSEGNKRLVESYKRKFSEVGKESKTFK
ncbi:hypothetical protein Pcinc_029505 [Petrolisthes cinctipes]|uniref:Uncharacterized protein n=1 Tax=Petrolisthes cinctipes TaxID=88211 RepID=A0AAE1F184_PETCI|nr:hypothetical protein Pcinc_029505 [Petrolisthes cinctipes]